MTVRSLCQLRGRITNRTRCSFVAGLVLCLLLSTPASAALPPDNAVPGGIAVVGLGFDGPEQPAVRFGNRPVLVLHNRNEWHAVVGLSSDLLPGHYVLNIDSEQALVSTKKFRVRPLSSARAQRTMTLPDNLSGLTFNEASEPVVDAGATDEWYARLPGFEFAPVVESRLLIPFGLLVNPRHGGRYVKHTAVTYFCPANALVYAPAQGRVDDIMQDPETGYVVTINHGQGLFSILSHLSETVARPGQELASGDLVGVVQPILDNQNGRVDWALILNGSLIDPLQFSPSG